VEGLAKRSRGSQAHDFDAIEHLRRQRELMEEHERAGQQADRQAFERWQHTAWLGNLVLPAGWLRLGVMSAAEGQVVPAMLGLLGMALIGTASLWRSCRTTIGQYQG